jgi:hypothetical protein
VQYCPAHPDQPRGWAKSGQRTQEIGRELSFENSTSQGASSRLNVLIERVGIELVHIALASPIVQPSRRDMI